MKPPSFSEVLVAGSSPVSLLYSLLLRKMKYKVTIATGDIFGGAWQRQKYSPKEFLPKGTHILMYSHGLSELLNLIGFKPSNWNSNPSLVNTKGDFLDYFGQSV